MRDLKIHSRLFKYTIVLFLMVVGVLPAKGQGNLLISPRRVIFEGSRRTAEINLANAGSDTAEYQVTLVEMSMKEDGSFEEITTLDSSQRLASPFIKIFPRIISLGPNESQVVKVQLANNKQMTNGEYRSYIYFKANPTTKKSAPLKKMVTNLSVKMIPIVGIAIPVIIRIGPNTTAVTISDLAFQKSKDGAPRLSGKFNRTGNMSMYGDVTVEYTPEGGKPTLVGIIKGLAVYSPGAYRSFVMDLKDIDYGKGNLHVVFAKRDNEVVTKITEADLSVN